MTDEFSIRRMRRAELDLVVGWAAAEGWNPGLDDADAFFAADPDGFFIGLIDGEPIASISVVSYGSRSAFLGFYIVRPEWRGRGYGFRLWRYALAQTQVRPVGLDGVIAQVHTYERAGFTSAYRNIRYVIRARETAWGDGEARPIDDADLPSVWAYDQGVFGASREEFLAAWLRRHDTSARLIEKNGRVAGYGAIRPALDGFRVGPLFADGPESAASLLGALLVVVPTGSAVSLDVPDVNPEAKHLAQRLDGVPTFETERMYLGAAPAQETSHIYGITSFELG